MAMRIVVADDHPLVLDGVRTILSRLDSEAEIFEAQDYPGLLEIVEREEDLTLVILDLNMPGMDGLDGLAAVQEKAPMTPAVILSASEDPAIIRATIDSGAAGYIFKSSGSATMLSAINLVLDGETYLPDNLNFEEVSSTSNGSGVASRVSGTNGGDVGVAALNHLPVGVIVVDENAKVVFINRRGAEIVDQSDGLDVGPTGVCRAWTTADSNKLKALVANVVNNADGGEGGALTIERPSMARALSAVVAPLNPEEAGGNKSLAAIFVTDPEKQQVPPKDALARMYELTDAEARVVHALVLGKRLEEVSEEFGVSMNTVRSHLKQAFRKTETNRQSELVKLVLTGSAVLATLEKN